MEPARWIFSFGDSLSVSVECPWRLIHKGSIAVSSDDHGQQFGLAAPIDAAAAATSLLAGSVVRHVEVQVGTADLFIDLDGGSRLEIIPFSSGYESWQVTSPAGRLTVAQGGGQLWTR